MSDTRITRGNSLRLQKSRFKYSMRKFYFANRVVDHWNSLPNWVITVNNIKLFFKRLHLQYWQHHVPYYLWFPGTNSRNGKS